MGREIRRVPPAWEHPKDSEGEYQPIADESYEEAMDEWIEAHRQWLRGEHPDQLLGLGAEYQFYAEWDGGPPAVDLSWRERWTEGEATHWVMYENVSEGTPLTPAFATREELVHFLSTQTDFWGQGPMSREAAEALVQKGHAPSGVRLR